MGSDDFGSRALDRAQSKGPTSEIDDRQSIHHHIGARNARYPRVVSPVGHSIGVEVPNNVAINGERREPRTCHLGRTGRAT
jgi:hypothetical protein